MIKLGLIGCGAMGHFHARNLAQHAGLELAVCCDLVEDRARVIAEEIGADWCTDYRQIFDQVDAVWVCTEPFNRVQVVTDAAAAGKHIFAEKPVALNLADADGMIEAARAAGVTYMLGYSLRFMQPYKFMRDTFASGELGDLVACWTRRYMPADMRDLWYGRQELSGGVALDFGSHDIDWLTWVGGPVRTVFAHTSRIREGAKADEHSQCMLVFQNGGAAHSDVTWWEAVNESSLGIVGTAGSLVVGRDGAVTRKMVGHEETTVEIASAMAVDPTGTLGRRDETGQIQQVEMQDESMYDHFIRCVQDGQTPATDAAIGREVLRTVLAVRQSAETGAAVDLTPQECPITEATKG